VDGVHIQQDRAARVPQRPDRTHRSLRQELARDFETTFERRPIRPQLGNMERMGAYLAAVWAREGDRFVRSVSQIVRGLGLEDMGSVKANRQRYRNGIANTLGYMTEMGWTLSVDVVMDDDGREAIGWAITVDGRTLRPHAPVAQLDRAAAF
jgi:hypothetical protein